MKNANITEKCFKMGRTIFLYKIHPKVLIILANYLLSYKYLVIQGKGGKAQANKTDTFYRFWSKKIPKSLSYLVD